ncbi:uncharacterized protein K02A2.6-like [Galleria mellonella]|uniref:RNA-directed DNA polymerase n=1 Tax=Galleria mellonella TaxID=7137 RepID=A0ABM3N471_GALME|nr:uncharacterized protein K02A2.6-like [Galleria mellonella]
MGNLIKSIDVGTCIIVMTIKIVLLPISTKLYLLMATDENKCNYAKMTSNLTNIVLPGHFNPKTDKWRDYKEQLLCALDAAGYGEQNIDKARSLFLSQCGKDTYGLIVSLLVPNRPTEVEFSHILHVLDKFYEPEINEILQTEKFHKRHQLQNESVQDFVAAISLLAVKCNFSDLQRQLRDRLVLGVCDIRLKRELLKTEKLTYESALQMCLNYQATCLDLYPDNILQKQTPFHVTEPMEIGRIKSNDCRHCARLHKTGERCPFVKARCYFCKRYGHIASACERRLAKVHQTTECGEGSCKSLPEEMLGVYNCTEKYLPAIRADVIIDGVSLSMEIDSGASRTIISEETYYKLWVTPPPLNPTNIKLVTWTREPLKVLGLANVRASLGNKEAQCELLVITGKGPSLLGRNWFNPLDIHVSGLCWSNEELASFIDKFPDLFKNDLGEYIGPEVSLHVRPEMAPKYFKARPVPFPLKQQVEASLKQMINDGVLTPVKYSKWATPIRVVKKDDGTLRICGDYRATVNAAINTDTYPLPTSAEAFAKLSGGRVFSKLDLKQAYTQVKVDKETAELLTLNTPMGLMRMNRLAFGVSAAPAIFQRLMSAALVDMEGVACLLDDIAVCGRNIEEHNERLCKVLSKLNSMGFRLNVKKCVFASDSITFLGHMIDGEGLHPSPVKVKEIKEKPAPQSKVALRAFLGLYNFYEKFLPDKATILEPLYRLLDAKRPWIWGEAEQVAFNKAKNLLSSDLTLVGYELNRTLLLICDSSDYGLGAMIVHVMDDGSERPIMMASRTLQPHERRYGQIDKEALAIIFGITKFHEYLAGRKFDIITDHKPLVGLFNPLKPIPDQISPRMLRWSLKLGCYNYNIKYRPGKLIGNADALSRWTVPNTSAGEEERLREVLLLDEQPEGWDLDVTRIAVETKKDPILQKVMFHILHVWPRSSPNMEVEPFWSRREALSHSKGCLLWSNRVIIPKALQSKVLELLHAPHAGVVQTKAYARGYVWWRDMDLHIERIVADCVHCQQVRNNPPKDPQAWIPSEKPWGRVHVDFAGPFQGKTFFVLVDSYSKWFEAEIIPSMSSETIINVLRKIFAAQGLPDILVSDNGRAFSSEEFNSFLKKNGIKHKYSPPYHPATNGHIERAIQTFKNKLKKFSYANCNISWPEKLSKVLYHLRTVPNSTNKTPAEILNGRRYRTAVSNLHPNCVPDDAQKQLEAVAQQSRNRTFNINQAVLIRVYEPGRKWLRATIVEVEGPTTYRVRTEDGEIHRRHVDQILSRGSKEHTMRQRRPSWDQPDDIVPEASPEIEIPDPDSWPDIIGIPRESV